MSIVRVSALQQAADRMRYRANEYEIRAAQEKEHDNTLVALHMATVAVALMEVAAILDHESEASE